jgi:soluble lytic murein transglycosylase
LGKEWKLPPSGAVFSLAARSASQLFVWGDVPAGIRIAEAVVFPVLEKDTVRKYALEYGEDPLLALAVIKVESNFVKRAKSPRGAVGLMQLMPNTAKEIAQELKYKDFDAGQLEDPETNIRFGLHHLSKLRREFGDDITVLAAYNAGGKNARDWLKASYSEHLRIQDIGFPETRKFAEDVLTTRRWLGKLKRARQILSGA